MKNWDTMALVNNSFWAPTSSKSTNKSPRKKHNYKNCKNNYKR